MSRMDTETQLLLRAIEPVSAELLDRLEDLSEADWVAFSMAVTKAALSGFERGVKAGAFEVEMAARRNGLPLFVTPEIHIRPCPDLWAERYGDEPA